ncbi:DUF2971 domain-containing protein [Morganella morganii]|uniref:DUF2971 domain-containing protein n=1 Tax=Morganella morganii TaxID=582 RepID=UPI003EBA9EDD
MELCHYTNLSGLQGIISSKSIWATNYSFLNDPEEFVYGLACLGKYLDESVLAENSKRWREHLFEINKFIQEVETPEIYTTSFCSTKDLLSQWRGYGQQGVCVVFKDELIAQISQWEYNPGKSWADIPKDTKIPKFDLYFNPVTYMEKETEHTVISEILNKVIENYRKLLPSVDDDVFFQSVSPKLFGLIVPFIKHPGFSEEGEYRLVSLRVNNPSDIKFRNNGKLVIPYVEFSVQHDKLPISEIVIGPSDNCKLLEKGVKMMLEHYKYSDVKVIHSNIPYRT